MDHASGEISHRFPWFLPDGRHFLYAVRNRSMDKSAIYSGDLDSPERKEVMVVGIAGANPVYAAPGHLLYAKDSMLMAQPFDAGKVRTVGDAVPIAERVNQSIGIWAQYRFSASQNGVLALSAGNIEDTQYTWFDRSGKQLGTVGSPSAGKWARISPDGTTVAAERNADKGRGQKSGSTTSGAAQPRLTLRRNSTCGRSGLPTSSRIAFTSSPQSLPEIYQRATSGVAQDLVVSEPVEIRRAGSVPPTGP